MSDIAGYERRIAFALDRIGRGVDLLRDKAARPGPDARAAEDADNKLPPGMSPGTMPPGMPPEAPSAPEGGAADLAGLKAALEAERAASAQLSERVRAIREKQDTTLDAMERKYGAAVRAQEAAFQDMSALKDANKALIAANRKLMGEGVMFREEALSAELIALRAARASERSELAQIIDGLAPLLARGEATEDA